MLVYNSGNCVLDFGNEGRKANLQNVLCRDSNLKNDDTISIAKI